MDWSQISNTFTKRKESYSKKEDWARAKKIKLSTLNHKNSNLIGNLLGISTYLRDHLLLEMMDLLVISPSSNSNKEKHRFDVLNQLGNLFKEREEQHKDLKSFLFNDFFQPRYPNRRLDLLGLAYNNDKKRKKILLDFNTVKERNSWVFFTKLILWGIQPLLPQVELEGVRYNVLKLDNNNTFLLEQEVGMNVHSLLSKDDQRDLSTFNPYFKLLGYDYLCNLEAWNQSRTRLQDYQFNSKLSSDLGYICRGLWLTLRGKSSLLNSLSVKLDVNLKEIRRFNSYIDKEKDSTIDWRIGWQGWQKENVLQEHDRIVTGLNQWSSFKNGTFRDYREEYGRMQQGRWQRAKEEEREYRKHQGEHRRFMEEEYKKRQKEREELVNTWYNSHLSGRIINVLSMLVIFIAGLSFLRLFTWILNWIEYLKDCSCFT